MRDNEEKKSRGAHASLGERKRLLAMDAVIMLVLLLFDQFTKYLALTRLKGNQIGRAHV